MLGVIVVAPVLVPKRQGFQVTRRGNNKKKDALTYPLLVLAVHLVSLARRSFQGWIYAWLHVAVGSEGWELMSTCFMVSDMMIAGVAVSAEKLDHRHMPT